MLGSHYGNRPGNSPISCRAIRNLHTGNSHYPLQQTALPLSDIPARVAKPVFLPSQSAKVFWKYRPRRNQGTDATEFPYRFQSVNRQATKLWYTRLTDIDLPPKKGENSREVRAKRKEDEKSKIKRGGASQFLYNFVERSHCRQKLQSHLFIDGFQCSFFYAQTARVSQSFHSVNQALVIVSSVFPL